MHIASLPPDISPLVPTEEESSPFFLNGSLNWTTYPEFRMTASCTPLPLIDLRSEKEFALGHVPGSVNLPLLANDERAQVGTLYKTEGKIPAVQLALELFAQKAPQFLESINDLTANNHQVGLYCWRGGMRSSMVGMWLASMGFKAFLLLGGYKRYRHFVLAELEKLAQHPLIVLNGRTGSGKSDLLRTLRHDHEVTAIIDFEALACHKGSAFGDFGEKTPCPSQQQFENLIVERYLPISSAPRILVEIENFIGPVALPLPLRNSIIASPMVLLSRDFDDRVERLIKEYTSDWGQEIEIRFEDRMKLLSKHLSKDLYEQIIVAVRNKNFKDAVSLLLSVHYDRLYDKSIMRYSKNVIAEFNLTTQIKDSISFLLTALNA